MAELVLYPDLVAWLAAFGVVGKGVYDPVGDRVSRSDLPVNTRVLFLKPEFLSPHFVIVWWP